MTRLTSFADAGGVSSRAATEIARLLDSAREQRGGAHLALSGGETPARAYELLAGELASWEHIDVWFADERCVAPEDERSNYRLADETLLARAAGLERARVHRMNGELGPDEGARRYEEELRAHGPRPQSSAASVPALDVIVLGIGPDGHIASLFPGAPTLDADPQALCLGLSDSPKPPPERITLGLGVLREARRCLLLATGPSKADAVSAMLAKPTRHVPASLLRRERLTVLVDDAASPTRIGGAG
jgi:6-phosphogluconolactonase